MSNGVSIEAPLLIPSFVLFFQDLALLPMFQLLPSYHHKFLNKLHDEQLLRLLHRYLLLLDYLYCLLKLLHHETNQYIQFHILLFYY